VKDREGNIAVDNSRIKQVWKDYFKKHLNEEFEWKTVLLEDVSPISGPAVDLVRACWTSRQNSLSPEGPDATIQRVWDRPIIDADVTMLEISMPEKHHRARLLALSAPHSGDWHALPLLLAAYGWTTRLFESPLVCGWEPIFVNLISALVALESNLKALTVSYVDEALAEQRFITPSMIWSTAR